MVWKLTVEDQVALSFQSNESDLGCTEMERK
jgi:hypothetical protein